MMVTNRFKHKLGIISLCLVLAAGLAPASVHPAAAAGDKGDLIIIHLAPLVPPEPLCVGQTKYDSLTVDSLPRRGYVSGVTVTLDGKAVATTGPSGWARFSYTIKKTGHFKFVLGAHKSGYNDATPEIIEGEAIECGWKMRMWYEEAVHITGSKNFWEAECWFKFPNQTFVRDENDNLVLTTGKNMIPAEYGCSTAGWVWPIKVTMTPQVQGTMDVNFSGTYSKGSLFITLSAVGGALPDQVQIYVEDAERGSKFPPVTWTMYPHADVINKANITNWQANPVFDYKVSKTSQSLFWPQSGLTLSGGESYLIVEQDRP